MTHEKSFSVSVMSLHPFSLSDAIEGSASCDPRIGSNVLLWRGGGGWWWRHQAQVPVSRDEGKFGKKFKQQKPC